MYARYRRFSARSYPIDAIGTISSLRARSARGFSTPRLLCLLLICVSLSACRDPRAEANIAEAMVQVGTEISAMRQDYAILQNQVDSLRVVVAHQDTIINRLASQANIAPAAR
jgi:hypothetical protein